jgi:hypothetical protein
VLPAFPFLFIFASRVGRAFELGHRKIAAAATLCLIWMAGSSLWAFPHSASYFNELVGGSRNGHYHLGDSNVDWGQDLFFIRDWYEAHPEARPFHLAYSNPMVNPKIFGIDWRPVPTSLVRNRPGFPTTERWPWEDSSTSNSSRLENSALGAGLPTPPKSPVAPIIPSGQIVGPMPGWYVLSVNQIHRQDGKYEYFLEFEPADYIAYSTHVYHITLEEANRVRRKMLLPELTTADLEKD